VSACFSIAVSGFSENVGIGELLSLLSSLAAASDVSGTGEGLILINAEISLAQKSSIMAEI
jgi:hypothetical protein